MLRLHSLLTIDECLRRLREQVEPVNLTFLSRFTFFIKRTSRVVGRVMDNEFVIEAAQDRFSKRAKGRLIEMPSGTAIEFVWETPFWSHIWGSYKFDEDEILNFFKDWLAAEPDAQKSAGQQHE